MDLKLAKFINPKSSDSKLKQLITLLICLFSLASIAQVVPKRIIYATYYQQDGEPGRTIDKGNGTEVHLMPVTHSETFLKIKRCGRAKHTTVGYTMNQFSLSFKYRWRAENDTLIIWPKKGGGPEEKYLMIHDNEHVRNLRSTKEGRRGYSRVFN